MVKRKRYQVSWKILLVFFILVLGIFSICLFDVLSSASTFIDTTQADFDGGTYNNTEYNISGVFVQLSTNESDKELPNNQEVETFYGGINMTGNVLLMHFNNDSNFAENDSLVYDFSGNQNNGTCSGATCPTFNLSGGKFAVAFEFDGSDDYIVSSSFNYIIGDATYSLWVKPNDLDVRYLLGKWGASAGGRIRRRRPGRPARRTARRGRRCSR